MSDYIIYARKSSESEDRQVLSLDAQVTELEERAQQLGIHVARRYTESRSAKAPGRPVFTEILELVTQRRVAGILCWRADRLSRNPIDAARLVWELELGHLNQVITPSRTFRNTPEDKFLMQLEFGLAKKYTDDLSENVKRGNRAKLKQGWLPGPAPLGYLNDREKKIIVRDPERFHLVRRIWDAVLEGEAIPDVLGTVNRTWGLRTVQRTRSGGGPISRSGLYTMLANPFYYGLILREGVSYPGSHEPMVTPEEFTTVQRLIGRDTRPPRRRQTFDYTGLLTCHTCGCAITAEVHEKKGVRYTYYRCSRKSRAVRCHQPFVRLEKLEEQFRTLLRSLIVPDKVLRLLLPRLEAIWASKDASLTVRAARRKRALDACTTQLGHLVDLRLQEQVTEEEYLAKRQDLLTHQARLRQVAAQPEGTPSDRLEMLRRVLSFGKHAENYFVRRSGPERRRLLLDVGSNFQLRDRFVLTQLKKPFDLLALGGRSLSWWAVVDQVRKYVEKHYHEVRFPEGLFTDHACKGKNVPR